MILTPQIYFMEADGSIENCWVANVSLELDDDFAPDAVSGHTGPQKLIHIDIDAMGPTEEIVRTKLLGMIQELRSALDDIKELPAAIEDPYAR